MSSAYYTLFMHRDVVQEIRRIEMRWAWQKAYRDWRKAGKPDMGLRELFRRFFPEGLITGEIGNMHGISIIEELDE